MKNSELIAYLQGYPKSMNIGLEVNGVIYSDIYLSMVRVSAVNKNGHRFRSPRAKGHAVILEPNVKTKIR